jgi:Zn ribbon nucleic-acid-binding protein
MNNIIKCADKVRAELFRNWIRTIAKVVILNLICVSAGNVFKMEWLTALAIFTTIAFVIAPRLIRQHRIIAGTSCPACNQPAGSYLTKDSRIYLACKHCGTESPTDCGVGVCGGIPYKITW